MTYQVTTTKRFEKEVALCVKRGYDTTGLRTVITLLSQTGTLPMEYKLRWNGV